MKIFIPNAGEQFRLSEEWRVEVTWDKSNLVWLREFGWTGVKPSKQSGRFNKKTDTWTPINQTVANPLFKTDDGGWRPALCVVPQDTILEIYKYNASYGKIHSVTIKCIECPTRKKLKNKNLVLPTDKINFNGEIING